MNENIVKISMREVYHNNKKNLKLFEKSCAENDVYHTSIRQYCNIIKIFIEYLKILIDKNEIFDNIEFKKYLMEKGNKNKTIKNKFTVIDLYMTFLFDNDLIQFNFIKKPKIKIINHQKLSISNETIQKILNDPDLKEDYKLMTEILMYTGMRKSVMLSLKVKDIKKVNQLVMKGRKKVTIMFVDYIYKKIMDYIKARNKGPNDYLFISTHKKRYNDSTISIMYKKKYGICPHGFRSVFITKMKGKIDDVTLQKLVGHESFSTTLGYLGKSDDDVFEELNTLAENKIFSKPFLNVI